MFVNCSPQQHSTDNNDLSGEIPSEVGELTALTRLNLSKCLALLGSNGAVEALSSLCCRDQMLLLQGSNGRVEAFYS